MQDLLPLLLNGVGGAVLGPILMKLVGGKGGLGAIMGLIGGVAGGVGAGHVSELAGLDLASLMGGGDMMRMVANLLEGGIGGGILGVLAGRIAK